MEKQFGKGFLQDPIDSRDFKVEDYFSAGEFFDWDKGYDVEKDIGLQLTVNDQGSSSSCVGQSKSKDREIKEWLETKEYKLMSARSVYARRSNKPSRGMWIRDACKIEKKIGIKERKNVPDYQTEEEMNKLDFDDKNTTKTRSYMSVNVLNNFEKLAQTIRDYKGCVLAFRARNNGTWFQEHPMFPRTKSDEEWGHAVFVGKAKKVRGEKRIYFLNSWGKKAGKNGWQYFIEEDFLSNSGYTPFYPFAWVTVDMSNKNNDINNMKDIFLKENRDKTLLIQDVEGTGEIAVLINGIIMRGDLNKVLGTYLVRTQGKGIQKNIWDNLEKKQLP